uniref:TFIIE domain-containing protein n=1 Tax=Dracunculus medinensis TaxID=318479 RepID=A0A0N4UH10_DRAME
LRFSYRFTLCIAKAFYGREHYVILDYIQKNICIKEDDLRQLLKLDQRFLRTILLQLKVDKILKEKLICEESDPRPRRTIYYYINYPAMINVVKYKVDHMRQRLEVKDKDSVLKATYKCLGCSHNYDAMDMDKIFDPVTEELRCWKCREVVEPDETSGPTDETRSSLARFNDQMTSLFLILQSVDGIRLARHLLEPSIKCAESIQPKSKNLK